MRVMRIPFGAHGKIGFCGWGNSYREWARAASHRYHPGHIRDTLSVATLLVSLSLAVHLPLGAFVASPKSPHRVHNPPRADGLHLDPGRPHGAVRSCSPE